MGQKRTRVGTAGDAHERRRLHFEKSALVEVAPDPRDDLAAQEHRVEHGPVDDEIDITPAIARLGIGQAMKLLRQRPQTLREDDEFARCDRELAGFRAKRFAANADDVAAIERIHERKHLAQIGGAEERLDAPGLIGQISERDFLTHAAHIA